ncbi:hypothetical protein ACICHK_02110 [Streptomyces sp. AHU1]|uniref:hypothetical protein n=1 Tax=Streptomyces sp. AHU1 TaxID=3377215 RepID=UPI0038783E2E
MVVLGGVGPAELFTGDHWVARARAAASGGVDFVTLEDGLSLRTDRFGTAADDTGHRVRGRPDPVVLAPLLPATSDLPEVVVTRNVTHSNTFHVAAQIDRHLRVLASTGAALFTLSTAAFAVTTAHPVVWAAAVVWGLGWGGMPTLLQTAAGHAGMRRGPAVADTAQAVLVTLWNAAMALGGIIGGAVLQGVGVTAVATAASVLGAAGLLTVAVARHRAFPPARTAP